VRKKQVVGKDGKPQQVEEVVDAVRTGVDSLFAGVCGDGEQPGLLEHCAT